MSTQHALFDTAGPKARARVRIFTVISVILRDGEPIVPQPGDRLCERDELMVVVPSARRAEAEERFRSIGRSGRLARWLHP